MILNEDNCVIGRKIFLVSQFNQIIYTFHALNEQPNYDYIYIFMRKQQNQRKKQQKSRYSFIMFRIADKRSLETF